MCHLCRKSRSRANTYALAVWVLYLFALATIDGADAGRGRRHSVIVDVEGSDVTTRTEGMAHQESDADEYETSRNPGGRNSQKTLAGSLHGISSARQVASVKIKTTTDVTATLLPPADKLLQAGRKSAGQCPVPELSACQGTNCHVDGSFGTLEDPDPNAAPKNLKTTQGDGLSVGAEMSHDLLARTSASNSEKGDQPGRGSASPAGDDSKHVANLNVSELAEDKTTAEAGSDKSRPHDSTQKSRSAAESGADAKEAQTQRLTLLGRMKGNGGEEQVVEIGLSRILLPDGTMAGLSETGQAPINEPHASGGRGNANSPGPSADGTLKLQLKLDLSKVKLNTKGSMQLGLQHLDLKNGKIGDLRKLEGTSVKRLEDGTLELTIVNLGGLAEAQEESTEKNNKGGKPKKGDKTSSSKTPKEKEEKTHPAPPPPPPPPPKKVQETPAPAAPEFREEPPAPAETPSSPPPTTTVHDTFKKASGQRATRTAPLPEPHHTMKLDTGSDNKMPMRCCNNPASMMDPKAPPSPPPPPPVRQCCPQTRPPATCSMQPEGYQQGVPGQPAAKPRTSLQSEGVQEVLDVVALVLLSGMLLLPLWTALGLLWRKVARKWNSSKISWRKWWVVTSDTKKTSSDHEVVVPQGKTESKMAASKVGSKKNQKGHKGMTGTSKGQSQQGPIKSSPRKVAAAKSLTPAAGVLPELQEVSSGEPMVEDLLASPPSVSLMPPTASSVLEPQGPCPPLVPVNVRDPGSVEVPVLLLNPHETAMVSEAVEVTNDGNVADVPMQEELSQLPEVVDALVPGDPSIGVAVSHDLPMRNKARKNRSNRNKLPVPKSVHSEVVEATEANAAEITEGLEASGAEMIQPLKVPRTEVVEDPKASPAVLMEVTPCEGPATRERPVGLAQELSMTSAAAGDMKLGTGDKAEVGDRGRSGPPPEDVDSKARNKCKEQRGKEVVAKPPSSPNTGTNKALKERGETMSNRTPPSSPLLLPLQKVQMDLDLVEVEDSTPPTESVICARSHCPVVLPGEQGPEVVLTLEVHGRKLEANRATQVKAVEAVQPLPTIPDNTPLAPREVVSEEPAANVAASSSLFPTTPANSAAAEGGRKRDHVGPSDVLPTGGKRVSGSGTLAEGSTAGVPWQWSEALRVLRGSSSSGNGKRLGEVRAAPAAAKGGGRACRSESNEEKPMEEGGGSDQDNPQDDVSATASRASCEGSGTSSVFQDPPVLPFTSVAVEMSEGPGAQELSAPRDQYGYEPEPSSFQPPPRTPPNQPSPPMEYFEADEGDELVGKTLLSEVFGDSFTDSSGSPGGPAEETRPVPLNETASRPFLASPPGLGGPPGLSAPKTATVTPGSCQMSPTTLKGLRALHSAQQQRGQQPMTSFNKTEMGSGTPRTISSSSSSSSSVPSLQSVADMWSTSALQPQDVMPQVTYVTLNVLVPTPMGQVVRQVQVPLSALQRQNNLILRNCGSDPTPDAPGLLRTVRAQMPGVAQVVYPVGQSYTYVTVPSHQQVVLLQQGKVQLPVVDEGRVEGPPPGLNFGSPALVVSNGGGVAGLPASVVLNGNAIGTMRAAVNVSSGGSFSSVSSDALRGMAGGPQWAGASTGRAGMMEGQEAPQLPPYRTAQEEERRLFVDELEEVLQLANQELGYSNVPHGERMLDMQGGLAATTSGGRLGPSCGEFPGGQGDTWSPGVTGDMFVCPITQELFVDPVFAADGYTYERSAIEEWLRSHDRSPMTNLPLLHKGLTPALSVKAAITEYLSLCPS